MSELTSFGMQGSVLSIWKTCCHRGLPAAIMKKEIGENIYIPVGSVTLEGRLDVPENADRIVIFSHGSGSSRYSPRNQYVAGLLNERCMATLLVDLLTSRESITHTARFDIALLTQRLAAVTNWIKEQPVFRNYHIAYFGASTGAASALGAASLMPGSIKAIVSRGGRPDLAYRSLPLVQAPVLLIVGSLDDEVLDLNREACNKLRCPNELVIVEGASHLFEETGKLQEVAELAADWFERNL
jgi:putative phosphoribosyl transferase